MKRTWMKATYPDGVIYWYGIDGDAIVAWHDGKSVFAIAAPYPRADDTLSWLARVRDAVIEGPFDEPQ